MKFPILCAAFDQHLAVCLRPATKSCTDHKGLQWYACDACDVPQHDTKIGSRDVKIERLVDPS